MADWQSAELKDIPELKKLSKLGTTAIEGVNAALKVVQVAGEGAKIFLLTTINPALLALIIAADAMIETLQNYKESGLFIVHVNPFDQPYGIKNENIMGLEMQRDAEGNVLFEKSKVLVGTYIDDSFEVNDAYRKSLDLDDLSSTYRDSTGYTKTTKALDGSSLFNPPIPKIDPALNLVVGGYDPATWTGTKPSIPMTDFGIPLPTLTAPDCIELLAAAFEDEGDVPRFLLNNATYTGKAYTYMGDEYPVLNTAAYVSEELYKEKDAALPTTAREPITTRISSGKPNYNGSIVTEGVAVSALAMVVAAQNPMDFVDSVMKFVGGYDPIARERVPGLFEAQFGKFSEQLQDYAKQLSEATLPEDTIRVRADNKYGGGLFEVGDWVKGSESGCIGKIETISSTKVSNMKSVTHSIEKGTPNPHSDDPVVPVKAIKASVNKNADGRWSDMKLVVKNYSGWSPLKNFEIGEDIFGAEAYTITNKDGDKETYYRIKYEEDKIKAAFGGISVPDSRKPKRGIVLKQYPTIPESETPDFLSVRLADIIPGYGAFFDDLINLAESIKAFAEGVLEAIQIIIDAIDDIVEYFEELAENIIALIKLLTQGLPNAGVWFMGMTSTSGSDAFVSALRSAGNAPDETYKISSGFCFVGAPWLDPDPIKTFFSALGVDYQSVG